MPELYSKHSSYNKWFLSNMCKLLNNRCWETRYPLSFSKYLAQLCLKIRMKSWSDSRFRNCNFIFRMSFSKYSLTQLQYDNHNYGHKEKLNWLSVNKPDYTLIHSSWMWWACVSCAKPCCCKKSEFLLSQKTNSVHFQK